ncbi:MAG: DNA repair exonuclease [Anaerolineae bacterium]|nr:DNA repair exonuclease [Anaerolineae bacterium]
MRFLHMADVHLGNQQYNLGARFNDFGAAFEAAAQVALACEVDAVVIAGDLFHKSTVDAPTLLQAEFGLRLLHEHAIPVLAVHGNHDKARYREQYSWVDYLDELGLLHLLAPDYTESPVRLEAERAYWDVDGVRFVGVPWLGASAAKILGEVAEALDDLPADGITFTVLATHAGVEGQMPHISGALTHADLAPLRDRVDYLALGHLHKPYQDGWLYNPGSLETCSFDEAQWADERGVFLVEVRPDGTHHAEPLPTLKRPFCSSNFATDFFGTPDALHEALVTHVRHERRQIARMVQQLADALAARGVPSDEAASRARPVVRVVLRGNLTFDRAQLDMERLRRTVQDEIDALTIRVENRTLPLGFDMTPDDTLDRGELERLVYEQLVREDARYGEHVAAWSGLMQQVKAMALRRATPEVIFEVLDTLMGAWEEAVDVDHEAATE